MHTQRTVLLAGATGLVGGLMIEALLADPQVTTVHALSRRALRISHAKLRVHLVDFQQLPELPQVNEVYLALGTTIKVAGSQAAFRAVDLDANLAVAVAAVAAGARRVGVVSAAGLALYMLASRWLPMGLFGLLSYVEPALLALVALLLGEQLAPGQQPLYIAIFAAVAVLVVEAVVQLRQERLRKVV